MSKTKKNLLFMLCFALIMLVAAAFSAFNANKAHAADATADDFKVASIGIRLQDNAAETGVRFGVQINEELLNKADAKVTLYMLPQMFYVSGAHLNAGAATAQSVEIPGTGWAGENGYKTAYAYVYDFPANNYGVKLLAEACLTYIENGATVSKWTAVSDAYSLTDVAKIAQEGDKPGADGYIIENARITYKNVVGEQVGSENLTYGATLNYPEVAGRNGQDLNWITSKKTAWNTSWTAQGNMTLICAGDMIDEKVFSSGGITSESADESAPQGFTNAWRTKDKLQKTGNDKDGYNAILRGDYYSSEDITVYKEVYFAAKTNWMYRLPSGYPTVSGWLYFTFTQNEDKTWNASISYTSKGVAQTDTAKNLTMPTENGSTYKAGTLAALLYNPWYIPYVKDTDSYVYFTEFRGVKKPVEITGDKIIDCVYDNNGTACYGKTVVFTASSEVAPDGFTVVKEYTCSEKSLTAKMTHIDIQGYSEVHFAIKTDGNMQIDTSVDPKTTIKQKYEDWLYFTLINESTDTKVQWRVKVTYQGKEIVNFLNTRAIDQPGVCGVLWHGGASGTAPINDVAGFKIYATELRGVKKK